MLRPRARYPVHLRALRGPRMSHLAAIALGLLVVAVLHIATHHEGVDQ